jgi:hypothetical protein
MNLPLLALVRSVTGRLLPRLLAGDLELKRIQSYPLRVAGAATPGATSLSFVDVPDHLDQTMAGDQLLIGASTHTIAAAMAAANGSLGPVPFTPALGQPVPARTQLTLRREVIQTVKGLERPNAVEAGTSDLVETRDWRFMLVGASLSSDDPPQPNDLIRAGEGRWLRILVVQSDPARALYHVRAR